MNYEYDKNSLHNCISSRCRPKINHKYKEHPTSLTTQFLMPWLRNCIVTYEYEISFLPIIILQDQIIILLLNVTYMVQEDTVSILRFHSGYLLLEKCNSFIYLKRLETTLGRKKRKEKY